MFTLPSNFTYLHETSNFRSDEGSRRGLVGYDAVLWWGRIPSFGRTMLPTKFLRIHTWKLILKRVRPESWNLKN